MNAAARIRDLTAEIERLSGRVDAAGRSNQRSYRSTPQAMRQVDRWIAEANKLTVERGELQRAHYLKTGEWLDRHGQPVKDDDEDEWLDGDVGEEEE